MIEWKKLPRGTYTYTYDGRTADVWQVFNGWKWTVRDESIFLNRGEEKTLDEACEKALELLKVSVDKGGR